MPLKAKLILLALIPVLLVSASISWISIYQAKTLGQREVDIFHKSLIKSKEVALKDTVDLAFDAISHIYNDLSIEERVAKARVKRFSIGFAMAPMVTSLLTINMVPT